jgi:hypothetical protein
MLDGIKKRLIHFESDGKSVVSDFVSARQRRVGALRRTVHACFYIQCAAALVCAVCGFAMGGIFTGLALAIGAAASVAAALMAVAGEPVIRLVSCALNLVYALICFIVSGNGAVFAVCGFVMLAASAAAVDSSSNEQFANGMAVRSDMTVWKFISASKRPCETSV